MRERPVWRPTARADEGVGSAIMKLHAMGPFDEGDDPPHSCWIGLNDQAQEGRFVWSDASSVDFYNFNPAEPNGASRHSPRPHSSVNPPHL